MLRYLVLKLLIVLLLFSSGCATIEESTRLFKQPIILAHGASVDGKSYNSLAAVKSAFNNDEIDGVEVDIVLTKDLVPILAHDSWVDGGSCVRKDGKQVTYNLISQLEAQELLSKYLCRYPTSKGVQLPHQPFMLLSNFLLMAKKMPTFHLYLDLKIQTGLTLDADNYAQVIASLLASSQLNNPLYIEVPSPVTLKSLRKEMRGIPFQAVISYPVFYAGENWASVGAKATVRTVLNSSLPAKLAEQAGADMVMSPTIVMTQDAVKALQNANKQFGTFLVDDQAAFNKSCAYGADLMIVDFVSKTACPNN